MRRVYSVAATTAIFGLAAAATGQVSIVSGFDTANNWTVLFLNTVSTSTTIASSGGNPGGYADLRPRLDASVLGGAGYYQTFPFITLGSPTPLTAVTMSADYRWFSGPAVTLVPFLWQGNLLYRPSSSFALGTSTAWIRLGPMTFPLSTFSTGSGAPLNYQMPTEVGFMAVITSESPATVTARVGIDNLNLQIIPAHCYANCDDSTAPPILNVNDFQCFLNRYAAGDSDANCDGSTVPPILNVNDFACFLNSYAAGCP